MKLFPKKGERGFTLIELMVVIAIIGMLSSIVLSSLASARNKANDAAIKQQMRSIVNAAASYYGTNGTYGVAVTAATCPTTGTSMFFTDLGIRNAIASGMNYAGTGATTRCATDGVNYAVSIQLRSSSNHWCVDSQSAAKTITTGTTWTGVLCP
jgi:prepilin-type N-terminal cleavage/methylation domain-containing protein